MKNLQEISLPQWDNPWALSQVLWEHRPPKNSSGRKFLFSLIMGLAFILSAVENWEPIDLLNAIHQHKVYPLPLQRPAAPSMDINQITFFSSSITREIRKLNRGNHLHYSDFFQHAMQSLPANITKNITFIAPVLSQIWHLSQDFSLDPYWSLAIMWTESYFNPSAKSSVGAMGLMQVMPQTAEYLLGHSELQANAFPELSSKSLTSIHLNLLLGNYYLKYLLQKFASFPKEKQLILATIAYNMGPYWVLSSLRRNRPVGVNNRYLIKVQERYAQFGKF